MKKIKIPILLILIFLVQLMIVLPTQMGQSNNEYKQEIVIPKQKTESFIQTKEVAIPRTSVSPNNKLQLPQYPENITSDISQDSWYTYLSNTSSYINRQNQNQLSSAAYYVESELESIGMNAIVEPFSNPEYISTDYNWDFTTNSLGWSLFPASNDFSNLVWETQFAVDTNSININVNVTIKKSSLSAFNNIKLRLLTNTSIRISLDGQTSTLMEAAITYQTVQLALKNSDSYTESYESFNVTFTLTFTDVIGNFDGDEYLAIDLIQLISPARTYYNIFAEQPGYYEQYITLTTHINGYTSTSGVYESASGVASIIEIARILMNYQSPIGFRLVITSSAVNPQSNYTNTYGLVKFYEVHPDMILNTKEFIQIDHTTRGSNIYIEKMANTTKTQWAIPERITNKVLEIVIPMGIGTPIITEKTWRYATDAWDMFGIPGTFFYAGNNPFYDIIPDNVLYHANDTLSNVINATGIKLLKMALGYITYALKQTTPKITVILNSIDITFNNGYTNISSQQIRDLRNSGYTIDQVVYLSNLLDTSYPTLVTRFDTTYNTWKTNGSNLQWNYFDNFFDMNTKGGNFNDIVYVFHNGEDIETVGNLFSHLKSSSIKGLISDHPSLFTNQTFIKGHETDFTTFTGTYSIDTGVSQSITNGNLVHSGLQTSSLHKINLGGFSFNADTYKYFSMKIETTQAQIGVNLFNEQNEIAYIFPYTDIITGSQVLYANITDGNWTDIQNNIYIQITEPFGSSFDPGDSFTIDWFSVGTMINNTNKPGFFRDQVHDEDLTIISNNVTGDYLSFGSEATYTSNLNLEYAVNTTVNCDVKFYIETLAEPTVCTSERGDFNQFGYVRFGLFGFSQNLSTMYDFSTQDMDYRNQLISWVNSYWNISTSNPMNITANSMEKQRTTNSNQIYHFSITTKNIATSVETNTITFQYKNLDISITANFTDTSTINIFIEKDNSTNLINVPTYTFSVNIELSTAVPKYVGYSLESKYVTSQNSVFRDFWSTLWQTKDIQYIRYNNIVTGSTISFIQEDTYGIEKTGPDPQSNNYCNINTLDLYCYPNNRTESHILITSPFISSKLDITDGTIGINNLKFTDNYFIMDAKKEISTGPQNANSDYYGSLFINVLQAPVKWNTDGIMGVNDTGLEWSNSGDAITSFIPYYSNINKKVSSYFNFTAKNTHRIEAYAEIYNGFNMRVIGFNTTLTTQTKDGDGNIFMGFRSSQVKTSAILVQLKANLREVEHNQRPSYNLTINSLGSSTLITWISNTGVDTIGFIFVIKPKNAVIGDDPERKKNSNTPIILFIFFILGMTGIGVFIARSYFKDQYEF